MHTTRSYYEFFTISPPDHLFVAIPVILLFVMKVPARFRLPVALVACVIVHKGRADCNSLIEAATPIFTNVLPDDEEGEEGVVEEEEEEEEEEGEESGLLSPEEKRKKKKTK